MPSSISTSSDECCHDIISSLVLGPLPSYATGPPPESTEPSPRLSPLPLCTLSRRNQRRLQQQAVPVSRHYAPGDDPRRRQLPGFNAVQTLVGEERKPNRRSLLKNTPYIRYIGRAQCRRARSSFRARYLPQLVYAYGHPLLQLLRLTPKRYFSCN
jgi:hypothetical protein